MSHIPPILLSKLSALRRRERLLHLLWGLARAASVILAALLAACFADWLIDLWDDTPWGLRYYLHHGQLWLAGLAFLGLLVFPQLRRLRYDQLALWVEDKWPVLQHRLISALQLNRKGARTLGMSSELMAAVTQEAVAKTEPLDFPAAADHRRIRRSAWVFCPISLLALVLFVLDPAVAIALLQRQMLADVDIPRNVHLVSIDQGIWPSGEEVQLRFEVRGAGVTTGRIGSVRVAEEEKGQARSGRVFRVPLALEKVKGDASAVYVAKVPPAGVNFTYIAKLMDGRTRAPGSVAYVPRPSIVEQTAYLVLPEYVGLKPDGNRYEQAFPRGDIVGMAGLEAKVIIKTQKPIRRAVLELIGSPYPDLSGPAGLTRVHEQRARVVTNLSAQLMRGGPLGPLSALGTASAAIGTAPTRPALEQEFAKPVHDVEWRFDLRANETSYRVEVFDVYGFASKTETLRTIKIEPEPPPRVILHAERFDPPPEFKSRSKSPEIHDFEGMPLPLVDGVNPGPFRISYEAYGPYGIGKAQLKIGVIRGTSESEDLKNPKIERWVTLPLDEVPASTREFSQSAGAFVDSTDDERVPFYALPSKKPEEVWPRIRAGGRYEYRPAGFLDDDGNKFLFKPGDMVIVYVEVFSANPDAAKALVAKSRPREREVVPWETFFQWCTDTLQEASRIEGLVHMQQRVYDRPWFSIFGFGK